MITADILRKNFGFNDPNVINNILSNPSEVARYERELAGITGSGGGVTSGTTSTTNFGQLAQQQQAKEADFLARFKASIPQASQAISQELGLDTLKQNALTAGNVASNITGQLEAIPGTQETIAKQVGISAPRLQQRIASKTAELSPALSSATRGLESANTALSLGLQTYGTKMGEALLPYQTEASMLSDSLAREMTGYTTEYQGELSKLLQEMQIKGQLDLAKMQRANELADREQAYLDQRQLIDQGNRQTLINPHTGQEIASYITGLTPTRGGATVTTGW